MSTISTATTTASKATDDKESSNAVDLEQKHAEKELSIKDYQQELYQKHKTILDLRRRLIASHNQLATLRKIVVAPPSRHGWEPFEFKPAEEGPKARLTPGGRTATNSTGAGHFVNVHGPTWTKGGHSFRIRLDSGSNFLIGVASAAAYDIKRSANQFVGQSAGIALHTNQGVVICNGKEIALGDLAVAKSGDDIGVRVEIGLRTIQFFINGIVVCRPIALPSFPEGAMVVLTLPNEGDQVTLLFNHPEEICQTHSSALSNDHWADFFDFSKPFESFVELASCGACKAGSNARCEDNGKGCRPDLDKPANPDSI